ncbi:hypothetical protein R69658_06055 [Paraburkholderia aspalathi]|uniref:Surface antigen n=1 Tax=Paraburkholderia aspalathi TaxID=1324617 RepID=A0A1I6XX51_9BURK|nr:MULTISPECIES: hypothetical protein [Paraburkholderia]MBK3822374.1 hypothetical protein [Paraburkholderia aspalathi]MBK3834196.1 hypothetical protein [Paraburkholderia aspalathi]MBK3863931.1 hypothetical protein [Paraburkholderia aspalathi]MCX4142081.1 hypothetical protein [Paraburkholderia aspalathi]MDN7174761.1 hypothetical protein [Paraburkholderia sp. SEWSISQ10-3 4]
MLTSHQFGTRLRFGVACLCLCAVYAAPVEAQSDANANAPSTDTSTCRFVVGQAEIDGVMQQVSGRACQQPDGSWQIVEDDAAAQAMAPAPVYYNDPWYWGPPVLFGGVSVIFVDRFHHFHHMDHVHYVHGSYGMGGRGWHGGGSAHMWGGMSHGMSHGGGGMHR